MHWIRSLGAKFDLPLKFWLIALIALINSVSFTIIIPVFYPYAQKFGLNDFQASRLTSGYAMPAAFRVAIAQFFATPLLGRSDVFGRKPLLVISLFGTVVANLLASFTPVASLLFVARVFDGLTRGNTSIVSYSTPFLISGILTLATAAFALRLKSIIDCRCKSV